MYLMIEDMNTIGLQRCNKVLSFNQKYWHIAMIFSDKIIFTVDAVFVEMADTLQSY